MVAKEAAGVLLRLEPGIAFSVEAPFTSLSLKVTGVTALDVAVGREDLHEHFGGVEELEASLPISSRS